MQLTCFIILISSTFFGLFSHANGTINLLTTPSLLCEQDVVEFNCTLSSGVTYSNAIASLSINGSTTCITGPSIFNGAVPRLNFTSTGGTATASAAQYTISPFLRQDNASQYRCCADNSVSPFNTEFTPYLSLPLAASPSEPTIATISSAYASATICTGTITLTWLAVASDRPVTNYTVYLNGTLDGTTGNTAYTTGTLNLLEHYATYTVMATSCAGSSMASSPVMFTALTPAPPSAAIISISTTYDSPTSCTGTVTLTWLAVTSSRAVTSYEVLLNGTTIATVSPTAGTKTYTISMSLATFNGRYTVRAVSCVGSPVSNELVFTSTTPATPVIAISPYITSLQPSSCSAIIEYTLQQPADSRNVTSYYLSNASTVIQTLLADPNNMYSLYYDVTLNTTASLYIAAENCIGNSSQLATMLPIVQGVSTVSFSPPTLDIDGNLTYTVLFPADYVFEVNYTLYATATYKNGTTASKAIFTAVQNTNMNSTRNIPFQDLFLAAYLVLLTDVDNISVMVTVNSQCGQALNISSVPMAPSTTLDSTTPISTSPITSSYVSPSNSPDCPTYCSCTTSTVKITSDTVKITSDTLSYNTTPYLIGIIILVLLLLLAILANALLILFIIYLLKKHKKKNSAPKNQQNINTDAPTNTAHIYNYIDLNALAETNEEKHYYTDMATVVQSNATTATTASNTNPTITSSTTTNDDTNDRTGYYNVS